MKNFFSTQRTIALSGVAAVLLIFASCKKSNNQNPDVPVAGLMAFNLAPEKPGIGFTLSGNNLTNSPLVYTSYTGGYLGIYTGPRTVASFDAANGNTIASRDFTFDQDKYYSLFLVGYGDAYKNVVVNDNLDSLSATAGKAYIRYINAFADSLSQPKIVITDDGGNVVDENASFSGVSDFVAVTPGNITIDVDNDSTIQTNRSFAVEDKKVYTALFIGVPGATTTEQAVQIKYIENGTLTEDSTSNGVARVSPSVVTIK